MPLDFQRVRALCFDVDGTLSDSDDLYVRRLEKILPHFLFRQPEQAARRMVMWVESPGNAMLTMADKLGIDGPTSTVIDWMYRHRKKQWKHFLLVPGVDDMLASLYKHFPMAVVSARDERSTMAFLDSFNLTRYFDTIVTGQSAPHTKPFPDPIRLAARSMLVTPDQCIMIGDTTVDIRAGRLAGSQTVGVLCGYGEEAELRSMGADMILESTPLIAQLLLNSR